MLKIRDRFVPTNDVAIIPGQAELSLGINEIINVIPFCAF